MFPDNVENKPAAALVVQTQTQVYVVSKMQLNKTNLSVAEKRAYKADQVLQRHR